MEGFTLTGHPAHNESENLADTLALDVVARRDGQIVVFKSAVNQRVNSDQYLKQVISTLVRSGLVRITQPQAEE